MSLAFEMVKAGKYKWAGWFDISIKPPTSIHVLVNIKEWGCAIARLSHDEKVFICSLPHEDSPTFLELPISNITHWAVIPTPPETEV